MISPKEKGEIDVERVQQCGFTGSVFVSSFVSSCTLLRISMVPLEILVVMPKAWKKEVFCRHSDLTWGDGTSTGSSRHLIGQQDVPNLSEVLLGEHKAHIAPDAGQQLLQSWVVLQVPSGGLCASWCSCPSAPQPSFARTCGSRSICFEPTLSAPTMKHFG
ncbi:hypothetical protein NN561_016588 [Cricetulus griseus]